MHSGFFHFGSCCRRFAWLHVSKSESHCQFFACPTKCLNSRCQNAFEGQCMRSWINVALFVFFSGFPWFNYLLWCSTDAEMTRRVQPLLRSLCGTCTIRHSTESKRLLTAVGAHMCVLSWIKTIGPQPLFLGTYRFHGWWTWCNNKPVIPLRFFWPSHFLKWAFQVLRPSRNITLLVALVKGHAWTVSHEQGQWASAQFFFARRGAAQQ